MSLHIVSTPIGHPQDMGQRALNVLKQADVVIGEERKVLSLLLRTYEIKGKTLELLNEHSDPTDIDYLAELCQKQQVALVSDCGTPGFCDPGAHLVQRCRRLGIPISPIPGASALMSLISMSSERLDEFNFKGFLPAKSELRQKELQKLTQQKNAIVLMDTPYRLRKFLEDAARTFKSRRALIGINMTSENEEYIEAPLQDLPQRVKIKKAEFMLLIYPKK